MGCPVYFGQGSIEFLVILTVVLVAAALIVDLIGWAPSATASSATGTESKQYWTGAMRPFNIPDYGQSGDTLYIKLRNSETENLKLLKISVGNSSYSPPGGVLFKAGSTRSINISGLPNCTSKDDYFEYMINITYEDKNGINLTQFGSKVLFGTCSSP